MNQNILNAAARVAPQLDERALRRVEARLKRDLGEDAGEKAGKEFAQAFEQSSMRKMRNIGLAMTATLTPALGYALKESVMGASDLSEALDFQNKLFGENAGAMEQWAASLGGYSKSAATTASNQMGNFLMALDVGTDEAITMTQDLLERARDIGSAQNIDTGQVVTRIMSGLAGETEAVRRLGVDLSQTALEAKAMELGIEKVGNSFTAQQKSIMAYHLILEATEAQAGNFADTIGISLPNQLKEAQASLEDAKAAMGAGMLPATLNVTTATVGLIESFNSLSPATQEAAGYVMALGAVAGPVIGTLGQLGMGMHGLAGVMNATKPAFLTHPLFLVAAGVAIAVAAIWIFRDEIADAFGQIIDGGRVVGDWLTGMWENIATAAHDTWDSIVQRTKDSLNFLIGLLERYVNYQLEALRKPAELANWLSPGDPVPVVPDVALPRFYSGATAYPDGTVAHIADGGVREHVLRDDQLAEIVGMGRGASDRELIAELRAIRSELAALERPNQSVSVEAREIDERRLALALDEVAFTASGRSHSRSRQVVR